LTLLYVLAAALYWNDPLAVALSEKITPLRVYVTKAPCGIAVSKDGNKQRNKQRNCRDGVSIRRPFESCEAYRCVIVIPILLMRFLTVGLEPTSRRLRKIRFLQLVLTRACEAVK
jgi:hypothetical protein